MNLPPRYEKMPVMPLEEPDLPEVKKELVFIYNKRDYQLDEIEESFYLLEEAIQFAKRKSLQMLDRDKDGKISAEEAFNAVLMVLAGIGVIKGDIR